jgi:sensor domain CHASE-containing protein
MINLIVARHFGLISLAREKKVIVGEVPTITGNAAKADVEGKFVFGILPLSLAAEAASVTELPLNLPFELRGKDLSADECRQYAGEPTEFVVFKLPTKEELAKSVREAFAAESGDPEKVSRRVYSQVLKKFNLPLLDLADLELTAYSNWGDCSPDVWASCVLWALRRT